MYLWVPDQVDNFMVVNDVQLDSRGFGALPNFILFSIKTIKQLICRVNNAPIANKGIDQANSISNSDCNNIELAIWAPGHAADLFAKFNLSEAATRVHLPNAHSTVVTARDEKLATWVNWYRTDPALVAAVHHG